jgi:hypothetical protein
MTAIGPYKDKNKDKTNNERPQNFTKGVKLCATKAKANSRFLGARREAGPLGMTN